MLDPATRKWEDQSTTKRFKFLFYCDCCGKELPSPDYVFHSGFKPKLFLSGSEQRARELIWQRDHDAAYERANLFMLSNRVHICEICGKSICGDCAVFCDELKGGVCCDSCLSSKGYHGVKMWQDE